jgi:hypothetical protein
MTFNLVDKWIIFKATSEGPAPTMIEDSEDLAIMFINDAQARGHRGGWSYAKCPQRVRQSQRAIAGYIPGYRVSKVNDPNRGT